MVYDSGRQGALRSEFRLVAAAFQAVRARLICDSEPGFDTQAIAIDFVSLANSTAQTFGLPEPASLLIEAFRTWLR